MGTGKKSYHWNPQGGTVDVLHGSRSVRLAPEGADADLPER